MSKNAPSPPAVELWQAQNLRLVVFPEDPKAAFARDWWGELTGTDPDSSVRKKLEREDAGIYAGDMLVTSVDPLRLHWTLTRAAEPDVIADGAPLLGKFTEKRDVFVAMMAKWLPSCPPVKRIAFATSLLQEVPKREDAYKLLDTYLRHVEVHPESTDLMYRVNRRRKSKSGLPGLMINGLATWAAVKVVTNVSVSVGGSEPTKMDQDPKNYCALELDINTMPEFSDLIPAEQLPDIFQELVEIATDIATRGDVRLN